jgi:hypothetical protein
VCEPSSRGAEKVLHITPCSRSRYPTCFVEEIWAHGPGKFLDSMKAFEQRLPCTRVVPVGFHPGDAQESGRAYRRTRLFRLLPRLCQKLVLHGVSLPLCGVLGGFI